MWRVKHKCKCCGDDCDCYDYPNCSYCYYCDETIKEAKEEKSK